MHASRFLQFLSIPAALGLGTALILACSDGGPTSPEDKVTAVETAKPFASPKKTLNGAYDNPDAFDGGASCSGLGLYPKSVNIGSSADDNEDGIVCTKKALKK